MEQSTIIHSLKRICFAVLSDVQTDHSHVHRLDKVFISDMTFETIGPHANISCYSSVEPLWIISGHQVKACRDTRSIIPLIMCCSLSANLQQVNLASLWPSNAGSQQSSFQLSTFKMSFQEQHLKWKCLDVFEQNKYKLILISIIVPYKIIQPS